MAVNVQDLIKVNDAVGQFDQRSREVLDRLTKSVKVIVDAGPNNKSSMDALDDWEETCSRIVDFLSTCEEASRNTKLSDSHRVNSDHYFEEKEIFWREISKPGFADALTDVVEDTGKLLRTQREYIEKTNKMLAQANKQANDFRRLIETLGISYSGPIGIAKLAAGEFYASIRAKHLDERYEELGMKIKDEMLLIDRRKRWTDYVDAVKRGLGAASSLKNSLLKEAFSKQVKIYEMAGILAEMVVGYHEDIRRFLEVSGSLEKADALRNLVEDVEGLAGSGPEHDAIRVWVSESSKSIEEYRQALREFTEISGSLTRGVFLRDESRLSSVTDQGTLQQIQEQILEAGQVHHRLEQDIEVEMNLMSKRLAELQQAERGEIEADELLADPELARQFHADDIDVGQLYRVWQSRKQ